MTIHMTFPGFKPMAKARPRFGQGYVHMPKPYVDWKYAFAARAKWQYNGEPLEGRLSVDVVFATQTGSMRPDLDNAFGAVADALQEAGVIGNDRQIVGLSCHVEKAKKSDVGIVVTVDVIDKADCKPASKRKASLGNPTSLAGN